MVNEAEQALGTFATNVSGSLAGWFTANPVWATLIIAVLIFLAAWLAQLLTTRYLIEIISRITRRTSAGWDSVLRGRQVLSRLSRAVPLIIIRAGLPLLPLLPLGAVDFLQRVLSAVIMIVIASAVAASVSAFGDLYEKNPKSRERPIKSYLQGLIIVIYALAAVAAIASPLNRDPLLILSGMGAGAAILLRVVQCTILSLVAGAQLTSTDRTRVGAWIETPAYQADGDVVEVALNTVKVQNWDKTFTVIPAHVSLKNSFKNYRTT